MGGLQIAFVRVSSEESDGVLVAFHLFFNLIPQEERGLGK